MLTGANAGHYTAYTRHSVTNEWFYSNDETVVRQTPHDADYSSMYILFYQRRGSSLLAQYMSHICHVILTWKELWTQ